MTAEVAIINRHGIAIAADSAVTVGNERVWKNTNKIFSLGPRNDIGIMVYGNGDFSSFPWEVVVKSFKRASKDITFDSVDQCRDAFLLYLHADQWFDPIHSKLCCLSIIVKELQDLREEATASTKKDLRAQIKSALTDWIRMAKNQDICLPALSKTHFLEEMRDSIDSLRKDIFPEFFPKYICNYLDEYLFEYMRRAKCVTNYQSGVVICGYGSSENLPVVREVIVDGRYNNFVRAWDERSSNMNVDRKSTAQIIPFAQRDMTELFMEGISDAYIGYFFESIELITKQKTKDIIDSFVGTKDEKTVERAIQRKIDKTILERLEKDFVDFRQKHFINPLMANVRSLPREEMAAMAEALVELTSLRRKIDSALQSVAGPVDVVFISKSDGFVWIKRKHYFDVDRNREFLQRKILLES